MASVLLICNLGVSTHMLKEKMAAAFAASGQDLKLEAQPRSALEERIEHVDIVVIAPQIAYLKDEVAEICDQFHKKYFVIPFQLYGNMDGEGVTKLVLDTLAS